MAHLLSHHAVSEPKTLDDVRWLFDLMQSAGSLRHARRIAARHAQSAAATLAALDWLPDSHHRDALAGLVDYVHGRTS